MKKMFLGLSLAVAALGFLTAPAMAAPVLSVSDQAFLASLAKAPAGTPAPELAAKRPHIGLKDTCIANCANGGTVSCSGTGSCSAVDGSCPSEPGHVTCNGVTTACSACPPGCGEIGVDWCNNEDACAANCSPCDYTYTCNATFCTDHCRCNFRTCLQ